jgi:DNA modification methylase
MRVQKQEEKQKPQPLGYNRYDSFLIFTKGEPKRNKIIKDVIHIIMDKQNYRDREFSHPHQKPNKCAEKLITAASKENDIILDPFAGSGTFNAMALLLKRHTIGFEIDKKFCDIATRNIDSTHKLIYTYNKFWE